MEDKWYNVASDVTSFHNQRLHTCIEGRYITLFHRNGKLSCIDSVCHHAGGPLCDGELQEIEDLTLTVVSCPWHRFLVDIDGGLKVFQGAEMQNGSMKPTGWKVGKMVQRSHKVIQNDRGIFVVRVYVKLLHITHESKTPHRLSII